MNKFDNKYRIDTNRLPHWDYSSAGYYFVTICTAQKESFLGTVKNDEFHPTGVGNIAKRFWERIAVLNQNIDLDTFIIMPNHIHGIVIIKEPTEPTVETLQCNVSTGDHRNKNVFMSKISPKASSLGAIIRSYKAAVTRWARGNGYMAFGRQSRYYDHIIRNEKALTRIRKYIQSNPYHWSRDPEKPSKALNYPSYPLLRLR